jgi:hypothetical protein
MIFMRVLLPQPLLAATASAHDDEDIAVIDREIEVSHEHEASVGHGQVADRNVRLSFSHPFLHRRCTPVKIE